MKIFPLRADFGGFFPASMQAEMALEMPTRLCEKDEHKMQKKQNPRQVWVGWQTGSKTPVEIQPWSCQILPDKEQHPGAFPTFPGAPSQLSSIPPFQTPPNLQNLPLFPQAQIYFLLNVKKPHELEQEETLDVFIASSFLLFFKDTFQ